MKIKIFRKKLIEISKKTKLHPTLGNNYNNKHNLDFLGKMRPLKNLGKLLSTSKVANFQLASEH